MGKIDWFNAGCWVIIIVIFAMLVYIFTGCSGILNTVKSVQKDPLVVETKMRKWYEI